MPIVTYNYYEDYKKQFDSCMNATANNFVRIGFLLKQARDTDILKESGYSGMGEFARQEYGLDDSTTSRFISICERYGDGDDKLLPEYEPYGYSKLAEMLTLPESVADAILPEMTKEEIREVKQEVKEEEKISDVEAYIEKVSHPEVNEDDPLIEMIKAYLKEYPKDFKAVMQNPDIKAVEILAPSGSAVLMSRVSGIGRMMLTIDEDKPVKLVNVRANSSTEYTSDQVEEAVNRIFEATSDTTPEGAYIDIYGVDMPRIPEEKVEPVKPKEKKPKKPEVKVASKKPEKVIEEVKEEPKEEVREEEKEEVAPVQEGSCTNVHEDLEDHMNPPVSNKEQLLALNEQLKDAIEHDDISTGIDICTKMNELFDAWRVERVEESQRAAGMDV